MLRRLTEHRERRAEDQVLLVLATDAANLAVWPIADLAGLTIRRVTRVLDRLEDEGTVTAAWEPTGPGQPRRRCYRLTRAGRIWAYGQLGLKPRPLATTHQPKEAPPDA